MRRCASSVASSADVQAGQGYAVFVATAPRLEPDPFDKEVEVILGDPEVVADLDEQHAKFERGELKLHTNDAVKERLRTLGVPLLDDPHPGT